MGMAASQARLLTITARLADNELKSQTINNAKMRLAAQSSQASENYINALNNATLKFTNYDATGASQIQPLTYNALTAYSSYNTQYGLVNASGQILVSESEARMFLKSKGNLETFLGLNGLEYTTTYFENLGALENDAYPEPFKYISVDAMQSYYEQYNSYENSVEVENFQNSYNTFMKATSALNIATESAIDSYLVRGGDNTIALRVENNNIVINPYYGLNPTHVNNFKNAFLTGTSNYSIANLLNANLISKASADSLTEQINNVSYTSKTVTAGDGTVTSYSGVQVKDKTTLEKSSTDTDIIYNLGDDVIITVDKETNSVKSCTANEANLSFAYAKDGLTMQQAIDSNINLKDFVNSLVLVKTDDEGTSQNYYYSMTGDGSKDSPYVPYLAGFFTDRNNASELYNSLAAEYINNIRNCINKENFSKRLMAATPLQIAQWGVDLDKVISSLGKTIGDVLTDYNVAKEKFLGNIFKDVSAVDADLAANYSFKDPSDDTKVLDLTPENLKDVDFILKYLRARGLNQADTFNTVIKEHLINLTIEANGEPKYAWVDENDPQNTGNADAKAQWLTNLFNRMQQGYKILENGLATSSKWLENALETGILTLEQVDKSFNWKGLDYKTCTRITEETDDAAVTKAEAEYNRAMNDIKAKDNIFDIQLKNIDTEHSSLQTEYESIKGVISKNIERTFKFNQSA